MSDTVPIYGERYLQNIIDRKIASENDVDYAEIIKKIIHTSSLENDYIYYQMRTHAKDHHSLERLFRGDNVYIRVLAEAANLAEMDIFLIHERNQTVCNLTRTKVAEAIDLILKNAGVSYRKIPKGANREVLQLRQLHDLDSFKSCNLKMYTVLKLLYWLDIKIALQYSAARAARESERVQNMTQYAGQEII